MRPQVLAKSGVIPNASTSIVQVFYRLSLAEVVEVNISWSSANMD
jgi:hypothetical protein